MELLVGDYRIVWGSRPTNFSIYKKDQWITQAVLEKGVLKGVEDNTSFDKKTQKAIRKAIVDHLINN